MSNHRVDVVKIKLEPHGNADSLSIVKIMGYTCVVRTADWIDGQLAAYVEPDYVVPLDRPEFGFLRQAGNKGGHRVKVKRLRGIISMGLLIHAPPGSSEGDNVIDHFGIFRYEPQMKITSGGGEAISAPPGVHYKYDVESAYRYKHLFQEGEEVVATEKVHGANARFCSRSGVLYCGSRTEWKRYNDSNLWWRILFDTPELQKFIVDNENITVYGEVYGQVQDLKYGVISGAKFICFDLLRNGDWIGHDEARTLAPNLDWVPILYRGPWDSEKLFTLADGNSIVSTIKQIREGIVVKPIAERRDDSIGRVQLKIVSNSYLERA